MKRIFDFILAAVALVILSPVLLLTALLILFLDGGPVLFRQIRIGRGGQPFRILKFRTMKVNSSGPQITVAGDRRITRTGNFLRKTKFDEIPQLFNVIRGDMAFVGPRPEVERYVSLYSLAEREILSLTPGITDPASLIYSNENEILREAADPETHYVNVIMPHKIAINRAYAGQASFFSDLRMIASTVLHGLGFKLKYLNRFDPQSGKSV